MTIHQAQQMTLEQLKLLYEEREAANIMDWVMEHITGKKRIDRLLEKQVVLNNPQLLAFNSVLQQLATHKPIQYILGETWFSGIKFFVNEHVLIPRPETEELVEWMIEEIKNSESKIKNVLDIGTGSGCIPITLKKRLPSISITSIDVSKDALNVAGQNADTLQVEISFLPVDFLNESNWNQFPVLDVIVSNPPYIKQSEYKSMSKNVLDFEPSLALFVPDEDALLFYRKIAVFAKKNLSKNGAVFLEINEALGKEVMELYENYGYVIELRKDMQGKERMMKAKLKI